MLQKTGDLVARIARWAPMLPSQAFITMSVWMLSDNIRPRDVRAVTPDRFCANPSAQIEQGSPPSGDAVFKSRNSTSMMNFPVNGTSTAQTKSSLFLSCLSFISIPVSNLERIGFAISARSQIFDPPLGKTRSGFDPISRIAHPRKGESGSDFMDTVEYALQEEISGFSQVCCFH